MMYDNEVKAGNILLILATLIFLGKAGLFWQSPNFTQFWDWPGHLEKAAIADWPWKSGWDTAFWEAIRPGHIKLLSFTPKIFYLLI